jgi:hypothetical protein
MKRASYHTTLKELTHHGLLPPKYEKAIPRTNLHRWRNDSMERFVGSEINQIADNHTELIKTVNEYPRMFYAYGRLVKTVVSIVGKAQDYGLRDDIKPIIEPYGGKLTHSTRRVEKALLPVLVSLKELHNRQN